MSEQEMKNAPAATENVLILSRQFQDKISSENIKTFKDKIGHVYKEQIEPRKSRYNTNEIIAHVHFPSLVEAFKTARELRSQGYNVTPTSKTRKHWSCQVIFIQFKTPCKKEQIHENTLSIDNFLTDKYGPTYTNLIHNKNFGFIYAESQTINTLLQQKEFSVNEIKYTVKEYKPKTTTSPSDKVSALEKQINTLTAAMEERKARELQTEHKIDELAKQVMETIHLTKKSEEIISKMVDQQFEFTKMFAMVQQIYDRLEVAGSQALVRVPEETSSFRSPVAKGGKRGRK